MFGFIKRKEQKDSSDELVVFNTMMRQLIEKMKKGGKDRKEAETFLKEVIAIKS